MTLAQKMTTAFGQQKTKAQGRFTALHAVMAAE